MVNLKNLKLQIAKIDYVNCSSFYEIMSQPWWRFKGKELVGIKSLDAQIAN